MKLLILHYRSLLNAIKRIIFSPIEHIFYIISIACIISLFMLSLVLKHNIGLWQQANITYPQLTIYLKPNATAKNLADIEKFINKYDNKVIKDYQYISKDEALKSISKDPLLIEESFDNTSNPLSDIIIVNTKISKEHKLDSLQKDLTRLNNVNNVVLDMQYANKITNLLSLVNYTINTLIIVFLVILILIVYSLIRLQLSLRIDEVTISRLIGAPNSFITRPLIYYVNLQIISSGVLASYIIWGLINQANLYFIQLKLWSNSFKLSNLDLTSYCIILLSLLIFSYIVIFITIRLSFKYKHIK